MRMKFDIATDVLHLINLRESKEELENKILGYLRNVFNDDYLGCRIVDYFIADKPEGETRDDGVWYTFYTDYKNEICGGTRYYPIENSEKYIAVSYSF